METNQAYYLGAYWGSRQESVEDCAGRLCSFLQCAAGCDSSFTRWFRKGRSAKEALRYGVSTDTASIRDLLAAGKDHDGLGFHIGLWNGATGDTKSVGLSVTCGGYSAWVNNACVVNLPTLSEASAHILQYSVLKALIKCVAAAFDPDWCVVTSDTHRNISAPRRLDEPFAGWLLYLPSRRGTIQKPDMPAAAEPINGLGTLLVATTEPFDVSNPVHLAAVSAVDAVLRIQGLHS